MQRLIKGEAMSIRVGIVGSRFVANAHAEGLRQVPGVSQEAEARDVGGAVGAEAAHESGRVAVEPHHPLLGFPGSTDGST